MIIDTLVDVIYATGYVNMDLGSLLMIAVSFVLMYLGIVKKYEPLLLVPIGFGA